MFDLDNIDKTEHYQIPDNYFEELPGRVMENIKRQQHKKRTIISSAVAAVAVLAIAVGVFFTVNAPGNDKEITQTQQLAATVAEEEALETVIVATNGTNEQIVYEASDLLYHLIVLLADKGLRIEDIAEELHRRHDPEWDKQRRQAKAAGTMK